MRLLALLPVGLLASIASAQTYTIDFNDLARGVTLSNQYVASNGVNFVPNAFSGANSNNTAEPWATNTSLTISDYIEFDPNRPGYAVGSPMLFDGNLVRTIADYNIEDGDPSVLATFAAPVTTATVTLVGIAFFAAGAFDTQLLALDASNIVLAQAHAIEAGTTSQQNLTVNVPTGFSRLAIVPGNYNDIVGFDNLVYTLAAPSIATWNVDADGIYFNPANWTDNDIPSGTTETARLGSIITQPRTVTLDDSVALNKVIFDSAVPYTIAGSPSVLTLGGADHELNVLQGSHSIQVRVSSSTGITKTGAGSVSIQKLAVTGNVAVNQGTLSLSGGSAVASKVSSVTVAGGAQLTLGQSPLILTSTTENALRLLLQDGKIASGSAATRALGYAAGATLGYSTVGGENIAASDIVLRLTRPGDASLDLIVNFDDLLLVAKNYGRTGTTWRLGDFTYDGTTGFDDLLILAQNYSGSALSTKDFAGLDPLFTKDFALAMSFVPEPTTLALIPLGVSVLVRRRK